MFSDLRVELLRSVLAGQALAGLTLASACGSTSGGDAAGGAFTAGGAPSHGGRDSSLGGSAHHAGQGGDSGGTTAGIGGDSGATAGQSGEGGTGGDRSLDPYPLSGLTCFGRDFGSAGYSGYDGQCCYVAACYTPTTGKECVSAKDELAVQQALGFPAGSGSCGCGDDTHAAYLGPYAANPARSVSGECCYLAASIGCEGRPLRVEGRALIAELVVRRDWGVWFAA